MQPRSHTHTPKSARECERMSPHTPKWTPLWDSKSLWNFEFSNSDLRGQNSLDWKIPCTIGIFLKLKCLKWAFMTHLNTYNKNCGRKKGWELKSQFDSRPLKVRNCLELRVCKWCPTYHWKSLNESYNFAFDLVSVGGLHKKLWASKVAGVLILGISRLLIWESKEKWHLG